MISDAALPDRVSPSLRAMTSGGSTGRPKLIVHGQPAIVDLAVADVFRVIRDGCHVVPGPLYHAAPFAFSMYGVALGNHLVILPGSTRTQPCARSRNITRRSCSWCRR